MQSPTSRAARTVLALLLAVLAVVVTSPGATAAPDAPERPAAGLPKTLVVGTEGVYPPFSYKSKGKLTGFDVEYMRALGKQLGVRIQFREVEWDSMFAALSSKRIDMVANQVSSNPERKALYDLSSPYVTTTGVVVVRDDEQDIKKASDLRGKRSAQNITSNWAQVAKKNGARIVGVDGMDKAIQQLRNGQVDAMVNDKLAVNNALKTLGDNAGVKVVSETSDRTDSVLAARKGSGWMPQIDKGIAELKRNGTQQRLYDKYFSTGTTAPTNWSLAKEQAWPMAVAMVKVNIPLTIVCFVIGLVLALGIALARMSSSVLLSAPARLFISFFRGIPIYVLLLLIYFGLPDFGLKLPSLIAAGIGLVLNLAAYAAEVIRSAIQSIPEGQWEAARTVGLDRRTTLRRIVIPQAARTAVPPLSNLAIDLLKSTSLVAAVTAVDMFRTAQIAAAPTFKFFGLYLLAALYFWVMVMIMTFVQSRLEKRVSRFV